MSTVQQKITDKTSSSGDPMPIGYCSSKVLPIGVDFPPTNGVKASPLSSLDRCTVILHGETTPTELTFSSEKIDKVRITKIVSPDYVELYGYYN